ncbi:DoxX family protein [Paraconexibacter algicola]|uniref:DoxX family protein n=1 Tax=Paraconexibacter algicola TaxID=2133960 RepID=A0A2T4UH59_9ACTN|nr:DoxX family protein [Paraconexibacter algicola]PTL58535.1 DoxX family protein [Paraconexibacter algicola]
MSLRDRAPDALAGVMGVVGSLHFVIPGTMAETIPSQLPYRRELVLVSGVVEVGTAIALRRRVPGAGRFAALTLLAIWPANIQMALDAGSGKHPGPADDKRLMWARVPLQLPLIWAALQADRPGARR